MAYFYSTHNFGNGEHFGFDVISLKVSQTELQSSRKSDTVLTQYPDSSHIYIYETNHKLKLKSIQNFKLVDRSRLTLHS